MADTDFRFDPFRQVFRPVPISNEAHVAQYFDALGRVGFFTREACQRRSPSSVVVKDAALVTLAEVSRTTVPTYSTYRVDYSALTYWSHSFVEVHETRIGQTFTISYHGLGMGLNSSNRSDDRFNLERSVTVQGNMTAESLRVLGESILRGSVFLATDTGATISASGKRIKDATESLSTDLITLGKFLGLTRRTQPEILTGSGNWSKPANVSKVFFVLVGPGGNGDSAGGGGGGGATVYGIADLDAIGGTMFAYVVGVVGIATTMFGCVAGAGSSASGASGGAGGVSSVDINTIGKCFSGGNGTSGFYLAVSTSGPPRVMTSADGVTWTGRTEAEANQWQGVAYGNGIFVAVSRNGTNRVMTSADGVNWTTRTAAENNEWNGVAFGGGLFVAVAQTGTNRVMTSPDGITWTPRSVTDANEWQAVTYGGGLFVAVAQSGTNRVMTSPDGINWTGRTASAANVWAAVTYGNGLYVATSLDGTDRVMTSPDAINWTARSASENNQWLSVVYAEGIFVAVSADGTNRVMTSPDGITWTPRSAVSSAWASVTHGNGQFVAVAFDGVYRAMTSPDGITWTAQDTGIFTLWRQVIYAPRGAGGSSGGGFGGAGVPADAGCPGVSEKFYSGNGGYAEENGESFGGGAGAGGTGADGLILLIY